GGMELIVPARVDRRTTDRVRDLAIRAFEACDCEGMARVDFFVRRDASVVVNELNTIPGFTSTSVYAKLLAASGVGYTTLLKRLVELAVDRRNRRRQLAF
ncbi:MAG: D-alanine--D-alanine ligase A, partial [Gaiellales bacterium]